MYGIILELYGHFMHFKQMWDESDLFWDDEALYSSTSCLCSPWMIQLSTAVDPLSADLTLNLYLHYWLVFTTNL